MQQLIKFLFLLLCLSWKVASAAKPVKHVVMFSLKKDATKAQHEQIKQGLLALPTKIPEIQDYELGLDLLLKGGQKHPAGKNRSICWSASFKSQKDYETYDASEAHKEFLALLKPLVEPGSRVLLLTGPDDMIANRLETFIVGEAVAAPPPLASASWTNEEKKDD